MATLSLRERTLADAERRAASLPAEVNGWIDRTKSNVNGLGIHGSQFAALKTLMEESFVRQAARLATLTAAKTEQERAEAYLQLATEIAGTHDLWRIFRYIISQRQEPSLRGILDVADLAAAEAYLTCLRSARELELVEAHEFREPPLVYLEAEASASTASRGYGVKALSIAVRHYRNMRLPIPIVLLPFDHIACVWLLCALHHEVGHNVDQDLKLTVALQERLVKAFSEAVPSVPPERWTLWRRWASEILADAMGVLLGGPGFAHAISSLFLSMLAAQRFQDLDTQDPHPPLPVRLPLLCAIMRHLGNERLTKAAASIEGAWQTFKSPAWAAEYVADTDTVARVVVHDPLRTLASQSLQVLVPNVDADFSRAEDLAQYLLTGIAPPDEKGPPVFPMRLVPSAAALASLEASSADTLATIHARSIDFARRIPRPSWLGPQSPGGQSLQEERAAFLRQLSQEIDFGGEA